MWRAALLLGIVACGGSSLTAGEVANARLDARCRHEVRCGLFPDQASCMTFFRAPFDPSVQAAVDAHRTVYDADSAHACIDALAAASCDASAKDNRVEPDACSHIFTGTGASGDPCGADDECASNHCDVPTCGMACCTGTCGDPVPLPKVGEPCAGPCEGDAVCSDNGLCEALVAPGGPCLESDECAYGYGCTGTIGNPNGTCTKLPGIGDPCPDGDCGDVGAMCNTELVCAQAGLGGDPCASPNDCSPFFHCDATGHCAAYPTRGMPCTSLCSDDSWCNRDGDGLCDAPKASGEPCVAGTECQTHFCDRSSGTGVCADVPACI